MKDTAPKVVFLTFLFCAGSTKERLQGRLDRAFNRLVHVHETDFGEWWGTETCPTPAVVLLLYGHVRTWLHTATSQRNMLERSSPNGCWFVLAVVPPELNYNMTSAVQLFDLRNKYHRKSYFREIRTGKTMNKYFVAQNLTTSNASAVLPKIRQIFGRRLSHVIVERLDSEIANTHTSYPFYWTTLSMLLDLTYEVHRLPKASDTIIVRSRPDCMTLLVFEDLQPLRGYFRRHTEHGRHLIWKQEGCKSRIACQTPIFMVTSLGAYRTDIALPIEFGSRWRQESATQLSMDERERLYLMGEANGWAYGNGAKVPANFRCLCLDSSICGTSCYMYPIHSFAVSLAAIHRGVPLNGPEDLQYTPVNLSTGRSYCTSGELNKVGVTLDRDNLTASEAAMWPPGC